jgi:serine/threonine-protein kinase
VPLAPGTRLGAYEILSLIGQGGMGEVYRARDGRLARDVAIKVLPSDVAADHDRLTRFEREAQVLASLNHPNIANIYGVDDSSGTPALVMELVDGPTLADRIAKGPIPLDEALPIAKQIAEALEAAHEQGIIHRDLKPANIKVRADGTVKVLDFGLAKAFDPSASTGAGATMSPTVSIHATQAGLILGTAAYMAPEQARGKAIDKRADIWAFGCVLFEMITERRAFDGDDVSTTLAAVLRADPEWSALPIATPPGLRHLLSRCFVKDPRERLRDIGEARVATERILSGAGEESSASAPVHRTRSWRQAIAAVVAVLLSTIATGVVVWVDARSIVGHPRASRLNITPPSMAAISIDGLSRDVAMTPDGSRLVYIGMNGTTLFVRPLDQLEATPLARGGALRDPFVSPDGQWVGFFEGGGTLKKVAVTGGPAVLVTQLDSAERGATWAPDNTIIFATASAKGLQRLSLAGGTPSLLTHRDAAQGEANHVLPEILPDGRAVLYTVLPTRGGLDGASIALLDLRSGRSTILLRGGSHAQYMGSGYLVYATAGALRAVRFDPTRLVVAGMATAIVPQVLTTPLGAADAVMARDGTLVYVAGSTGNGSLRTLVWVDRQGREMPTGSPPHAYLYPRVSPDGRRVAVTVADTGVAGIWLWDLARATLAPLTFDPHVSDLLPVWTRDGSRMIYSSNRAGPFNLFSQAADGTGAVERLSESPYVQYPTAVSSDGTHVVFNQNSAKTGEDVMALQLHSPHKVLPLVQTRFDERNAIVSPDGRWLAYEANDSGPVQIYVRPFPDITRGHWQISTNGGTQPLLARSGQEMYYFGPDGALMRVAVAGGPTWTAGAPTQVFEGRYVTGGRTFTRNYDIATDNKRFLMIKALGSDASPTPPQIIVVQHFDDELKRLVPTK